MAMKLQEILLAQKIAKAFLFLASESLHKQKVVTFSANHIHLDRDVYAPAYQPRLASKDKKRLMVLAGHEQ
jgi:hypothetical protein